MKQWWRKIAVGRFAPLAWIYLYLAYVSVQRVDPDFGWHYKSGQYILAYGVPVHDVFTYTARDFVWVNHEWLNDVLMYVVSRWAGYFWLGMLFAGIWTAALWLAAGRRLSWISAGLALGAVVLYVGIRGVTWTAFGLALVLQILRGGRRRYRWLPLLVAIWANVHAGFAIGLVIVALAAVMARDKRLAGWGAAAAAAALINPYGWGVYVELWRTMSDGKLGGYIVEWAPMNVNRAFMPYVLVLLVILVVRRQWRYDWARSAGLLVAAVWSNRHIPLMVAGSLAYVDAEVRRVAGWLPAQYRWARIGIAGAMGVGFPVLLLVLPSTVDQGVRLARPDTVLQTLKNQPCRGHVFNDYSYGGLMVLALPGVPDYIDGRMPSWSGSQGRYLDRYVEVLKGGDEMRREFAQYNVQCVVISKLDTRISAALAADPAWRLAVKAQDAELWRRD